MLIFGVCCFQTLSRAAEFHFLRRAAAIGRLLVNLLSEDHSSTDNQGRLRLIIEGYGRRVGIASAAWIICFGAAKWITFRDHPQGGPKASANADYPETNERDIHSLARE
jgi:hypothetical protein